MKADNIKEIKDANVRRFFILQAVIIVSLLTVIGLSTFIFYKSSKQYSISLYEKMLDETGNELQNYFLKGSAIINSVADNLNFMLENGSEDSDIARYFSKASLSEHTYDFTSFYGYINGRFIDKFWSPPSNFNPSNQDWYVSAQKAGGKIAIVSPYLDLKTNETFFSISRALDDGKSVISIDFSLESIQRNAKKMLSKGSDEVFILNREGVVLTHIKPEEIGRNFLYDLNESELQVIKRIFYNPEIKKIFEAKYNNNHSLIFSKKLLNECYLIIISDKHQIFIDTLSRLWGVFAGLIMIFVFTLYLCTTNFRARYKISHYATMLAKYKAELENKVIDQSHLIDEKNKNLVKMQDSVIEGMATIIEYRDANTGTHVQHTKHYVQMVAKYLFKNKLHSDEVTEHYVNMIGNAAAMHDIGKIAINDSILNKKGKLTEVEYEMMKTHTLLGAAMLRQAFGNSIDEDMLRICIDMVQYHHEKWDGSGYPFGFVGEDIPLSARIMAIADVFDALASKRVYKESMSPDEVFEIIKNGAGTHFDPELAEIFLGMKTEIKEYLSSEEKKPTGVLPGEEN